MYACLRHTAAAQNFPTFPVKSLYLTLAFRCLKPFSRCAPFALLLLCTIAISFLITPNYTAGTEANMHACVCRCINATSFSTAAAPVWGVFSTQFYTVHSARLPFCSRALLLREVPQSKWRPKSAFVHFCGCSQLCPQQNRQCWSYRPFQWATPCKALSTIKVMRTLW